MRLTLIHPDVAARSCSDCKQFVYNDRPGRFAAMPVERGGKPVLRPKGAVTPCSWCEKQPPTVPERERSADTAEELSDRNWQAYLHYQECRAVGEFPSSDAIVRRNAQLFRQAEDLAHQVRAARLAATIPFMSRSGE